MPNLVNKSFGFFLSMCIIMVFTSCEVQKRHFRNDYNISKSPKQKRLIENNKSSDSNNVLYASTQNNGYSESLGNEVSELTDYWIKDSLPIDSCGDMILLCNYGELNCKIFAIKDSTVEYKSCNDTRGVNEIMDTKNIKMIKFSNDSLIYFDHEFELNLNNPSCYDRIQLKNGSVMNVKILYKDDFNIKFVDCNKVGVIKKISTSNVEKVIYKNKSINIVADQSYGISKHQNLFFSVYVLDFIISIIEFISH